MAGATARVVTIATFKLCKCTDFAGSEHHVVATKSQVELSAAKAIAIAISYTWGEFDRRQRILGHFDNDLESHLSFQLGAEWDLHSFVNRLVQISSIHHGVWIDQACLPQDVSDEEWAGVLMTIPLVFKTLPVVALFPGRLCRCLSAVWRRYRAAVDGPQDNSGSQAFGTSKVVGEAYERLRDVISGTECIYSNGWCSWIDRIWPSEELRYSRQISVCWVEEDFAACQQPGNPDLDPEALTGLPKLLYRTRKEAGAAHEQIIQELKRRASAWTRGLWLAIGENLKEEFEKSSTHKSSLDQRKSEEMARFLLGDAMRFGNDSAGLTDLFRFVWACEILAQTRRQATKAQDYIFSVWADWPSYEVPRSFSHLTCFELLVDALDQFKAGDYKVFVPSSSPAGLTDSSAVSWTFSCGLSKDPSKIKDTLDVYRPLFWLNAVLTKDSMAPLHINQGTSRQAEPQLVSEWISGLPPAAVLECVLEFKHRVDLKFVADVVRHGHSHGLYHPHSLLGKVNLSVDDIYDFVCICLNLDQVRCREADLAVVCTQREVTTKFGSWKTETVNIACFGLADWARLDEARSSGQKTMSVNIRDEKWPSYEAVSVAEHTNQFSIVAVWVPLASVCECVLEAVIDNDDVNGFLV